MQQKIARHERCARAFVELKNACITLMRSINRVTPHTNVCTVRGSNLRPLRQVFGLLRQKLKS
jgi:hypothetical protein